MNALDCQFPFRSNEQVRSLSLNREILKFYERSKKAPNCIIKSSSLIFVMVPLQK